MANASVTAGVGLAGRAPVTCYYHVVPAESLRTIDADTLIAKGYLVTATAGLGAHATLTSATGVTVLAGLGTRGAVSVSWTAHVTVAERVGAATSLTAAWPRSATETLGLHASLATQWAVRVAVELGLARVLSGTAKYHVTAPEAVKLSAGLLKFLGANASEVLGVTLGLGSARTTQGVLVERLGMAATPAPRLLIRVTAAERVAVTAADVVRAIYSPVLSEQLGLTIGYLDPTGSFTAWVTNTRTGAVTEYDNYNFNSFARVGNKYIGARSDGIYELLGGTDAGTSIIAEMRGAYLQFGGTHMARLKAAYIAAHGTDGTFVLRIETLDGARYDYTASARSGRSSKVHMGKGQRSRYFAYTLTSLGQDFDLDTLEFVPIVVDRRV